MAHGAKRNPDRCPTHPGALLREDVIPATGRTKAEIAQLLGISRQHLRSVVTARFPPFEPKPHSVIAGRFCSAPLDLGAAHGSATKALTGWILHKMTLRTAMFDFGARG